MKPRVVVLGAGFGGLEVSTILSETLADRLDIILIDRNDSFTFGYSKLDVVFGRKLFEAVRYPYAAIKKPGLRFRQEAVTAIDPHRRIVTTEHGTYEADALVVALGADYDLDATPGLKEGGNEYYSFAGAERLSKVLPTFNTGRAIVGVTSLPFKCPPAPSEAALLLDEYLRRRGVRSACEISLVMPFGTPIPPSPAASRTLQSAFAERGIRFIPNRFVRALSPARKTVILDDATEMPYDLFLGIPKHCVPKVVAESGMTEDGWVPVDAKTLETRFPQVYAIGDVTDIETPKAGVFSEGAARVVASALIAKFTAGIRPAPYSGAGSCYIEFGHGKVGRVDVNFLSGPTPTGSFQEPSTSLAVDKQAFGSSRRMRWFGL